MNPLTRRDLYAFFRMGIVTGLIEPRELEAWADAALLATPDPDYDLVELSLAMHGSHSQILYLLSRLQGLPVYEPALGMIFARARQRLTGDVDQAADLVLNLRLLAVEERLPKEARRALRDLDEARSAGSPALAARLAGFLDGYAAYAPLLEGIFPHQHSG